MKLFEEPMIDIETFAMVDVITTSGDGDGEDAGEWV